MIEAAVYRRPTNYLKETTMLSKNRKSKRKCLLLDYPLIPFLQQRFQGNYIIHDTAVSMELYYSSGTKTTDVVKYVEAGCSVCIMLA